MNTVSVTVSGLGDLVQLIEAVEETLAYPPPNGVCMGLCCSSSLSQYLVDLGVPVVGVTPTLDCLERYPKLLCYGSQRATLARRCC